MPSESGATVERECRLSGFHLSAPPAGHVFRIGKAKYGPWSAPLRDESPNRARWGRWDSPGGRTAYAAASREAAFSEVLPYIREALPNTSLGDLFPDDDLAPAEASQPLSAAVRDEMCAPNLRDQVVRGWRDERRIYELALPSNQWLVDVQASATISALNAALRRAWEEEVSRDEEVTAFRRLTVSDLTGEDRFLTTSLAGFIRASILDDGSHPLGIRYQSKFGVDYVSYAIWLRATDDGNPAAEATRVIATTPIEAREPALRTAARKHGMTVVL